MELPTREY